MGKPGKASFSVELIRRDGLSAPNRCGTATVEDEPGVFTVFVKEKVKAVHPAAPASAPVTTFALAPVVPVAGSPVAAAPAPVSTASSAALAPAPVHDAALALESVPAAGSASVSVVPAQPTQARRNPIALLCNHFRSASGSQAASFALDPTAGARAGCSCPQP
jgi:hypothetical protein